jgi:hypothetical protein
MKTKMFTMIFSSIFVASATVNAATDDETGVDCSTASEDIAHLQHEKKSTDERKMKGVFGIMPIGIVVNAATGGYKKADPNKTMQIDEYNARIDSRIADIKKHCKVAEPENPAMESN